MTCNTHLPRQLEIYERDNWAVQANVVLMITAYAKSEKEDLSDADKARVRRIVESFQGHQ